MAEPKIPPELVREPQARLRRARHRERPGNRRSELERLLDRTVLEPTHPELGTCWRFTGTTTPYGRIAKAQDSYTHRLGWKLLRGPIPEGKDSTIVAASSHAGTQTTYRSSPMPRIWRSSAGHTASAGTRSRLRTSGSTPGRGRESAGHASGRTSGGSGPQRAAAKRAI
jgi:hypothetical protein